MANPGWLNGAGESSSFAMAYGGKTHPLNTAHPRRSTTFGSGGARKASLLGCFWNWQIRSDHRRRRSGPTKISCMTSLPESDVRSDVVKEVSSQDQAQGHKAAFTGRLPSKTGGASQHATTDAQRSSSQPALWPPWSCSGYES